MDDVVQAFCDEHDIDVDSLDDEIIEALQNEEAVTVCDRCGEPVKVADSFKCETCGKTLCESCFGDPTSESECRGCLAD